MSNLDYFSEIFCGLIMLGLFGMFAVGLIFAIRDAWKDARGSLRNHEHPWRMMRQVRRGRAGL